MLQSIKNIYHLFVALAAVIFYGYPAKQLVVIGVTGTDGKTTTSSMLYEILRADGKQVGLVSTVGAKIGGKTYDVGLHTTTPSPIMLQRLLRQMVKEGCKYAIIETTSHGLDQNRLVGCNFQYGILTNITHEHLDYHKTFARYVAAKAKLFRGTKVNVINNDGPWFEAIQKYNLPGKIISVGLQLTAAVNPQRVPVSLQVAGDYNLANALAAAAVAQELGVGNQIIKQALESFTGVEGRLEKVNVGQPFSVIVDFAHTPNATEQVLTALRKETKGKLIAMFGSAGLRDKTKRPITGEVAARIADICIVTADDPATEDVNEIISQIVPGAVKAGAVELKADELQKQSEQKKHVFAKIPDRREAIKFAIALAQKDDTVALLSKGHQKSFSLGTEEIPWNEKQYAIEALKELGYGK